MNTSERPFPLLRSRFLQFALLAALSLFALFGQDLSRALMAGDVPPHILKRIHDATVSGFVEVWFREPWLGGPYAVISPDLNWFIYRFADYPLSLNLLFSANLFIGGLGMYGLLRVLKLNTPACFVGAIAYTLTNTVVTFVAAGHVNKIMTYAWIPGSVAFFIRGMNNRRLADFILSGAFLGMALLGGESPVPYYLGLWYTAWVILTLAREARQRRATATGTLRLGVGLAMVAACALVLAMTTTMHSLRYIHSNAPTAGAGDPEELWRFATQYYFPPEEVLSYLTTIQFFGGPQAYWGHDGDPQPFRGSDDYMGLLPLGLAVVGGVTCWRVWQARLFIVMAAGSLLASFGKYGLVYFLIYQLPRMKELRNPHRWSYFVSFSVCVLAAYGADWLWKRLRGLDAGEGRAPAPDWEFWRKILLRVALVSVALCAVAGVASRLHVGVAGRWYGSHVLSGENAWIYVERARLLLWSLTRTGIFLYFSAAGLWWLISWGRNQEMPVGRLRAIWGVLLLVIILDLGVNARRYIGTERAPWSTRLQNHELVNFLNKDHDLYRVWVNPPETQQPLMNDLVTRVLPYNEVQVATPIAESRRQIEYSTFFILAQKHYMSMDRRLDILNVKYWLTFGELPEDAPFVKVMTWNHVNVYERKRVFPRAWLAASVKLVEEDVEGEIAQMVHPALDLRETVVMDHAPSLPIPPATPPPPPEETVKPGRDAKRARVTSPPKAAERPKVPMGDGRVVRVTRYEDNRVELKTDSAAPSILVLGEKWDPDWKAWVDDRPAEILRVNYFMRGVELSKGPHRVRMEYRPPRTSFDLSFACVMALVLSFAIWGWWGRSPARGSPAILTPRRSEGPRVTS